MNFTTRDQVCAPEPVDGVEWEETSCLLCDGPRWAPLVEAADPLPGPDGLRFMVVQCQDCGLSYTNPRPTERAIGDFYPRSYICHQAHTPKQRRRPRLKRDPVATLLPVHGYARLLDFGCGAGDFLRRMQRLGWNVTGLDVSEEVVARIHRDLDLPALVGTLPHPGLLAESFEAITMWQALEHVHRPLEVLHAARQLLTPGGRLLVAVPNIDSFPYAWFGSDWYALDVPRHLTHFTPATLRAMLQRTGFRIETLRMVRHPGWVRHSARLLARRRRASVVTTRLLSTRLLSGLTSWYSYLLRKSDCILAVATPG